MKVAILGLAGYLGWNLTCYLASRGYEICGFDNFTREKLVKAEGNDSLTPIRAMKERLQAVKENFDVNVHFEEANILDYPFLEAFLRKHKPDAVVHYAEIPSAPYSMKSIETAAHTQFNNVIGTLNLLWAMRKECPAAHLIKLATMGEYGTPDCDIPEGYFNVEYHGRKVHLPFPRLPAGSWYHLTKSHDTLNIMYACHIWGLRSSDLHQGPVYGVYCQETRKDPRLISRFDYDGVWGTVINRYCVQAIVGYPLSPYGLGWQKRGFIYIEDSLRCVELCILNPPSRGEHRVFNQFFELFTVNDLAKEVKAVCEKKGIPVKILNIDNPRVEAEEHYYNPANEGLLKLGIQPHKLRDMLPVFIDDLIPFRERVKKEVIEPKVRWK